MTDARARPRPLKRAGHATAVSAVRRLGRHRRTAPLDGNIAIFGAPRSGTTWLAELVSEMTGYGLILEPLLRKKLPEMAEHLPASNRPYHHPDEADPGLDAFLIELFTGRLLRAGVVRRDPAHLFRFVRHPGVITKEVRAQALLPYVRLHLPDLPVVLIVRDPRGVAASKVRDGFTIWEERRVLTRSYEPVLADHPRLRPPDHLTITPRVAATLEWFVEHAFLQVDPRYLEGVHVVRYEELFTDPLATITAVGEHLGHPVDGHVERILRRPSATVKGGSAVRTGGDPTRAWEDEVTDDERATIDALFAWYGHPFGYGLPAGSTSP